MWYSACENRCVVQGKEGGVLAFFPRLVGPISGSLPVNIDFLTREGRGGLVFFPRLVRPLCGTLPVKIDFWTGEKRGNSRIFVRGP